MIPQNQHRAEPQLSMNLVWAIYIATFNGDALSLDIGQDADSDEY